MKAWFILFFYILFYFFIPIRQLGTAAPYGCNGHIDIIGNLTSPGCQSVNVLNLFDGTI